VDGTAVFPDLGLGVYGLADVPMGVGGCLLEGVTPPAGSSMKAHGDAFGTNKVGDRKYHGRYWDRFSVTGT